MRKVPSLASAIALSAVTGCSGDAGFTGPPPPAQPSFVRLESDVGDYIGQGQTYEYTQADAILGVSANDGRLSVSIAGDESWRGEFHLPDALNRLEPGTYTDLSRFPFSDPAKGGMSWTGEGRGCNTLDGQLTIDEVAYEAGALTSIALSFRQHCEGSPPALYGTLNWRSDDPTVPPGPVDPPPSNLWEPAPGTTPVSGGYVYLKSDPGDYIGQGLTYTYTGEEVSASANRGLLAVIADGWSGEFRGMDFLEQLEPGYYPDLQRYPFHNPVKGGLSWHGQGRGCNRLLGWFVLDGIVFEGGLLVSVDLRFEQRCEGGTTALRGAVNWTR